MADPDGAGAGARPPIIVVVGNPQVASRTRAAGEALAGALVDIAGDPPPPVEVVELGELGPALLAWGAPEVDELRNRIGSALALVVASPTYKAAYTGLLKLFLDRFDHGELGGLPTVALMTGGSPHHALAVEVHLRPVLVEIGASLPTRGLYVCGPEVEDPTTPIARWQAEEAAPLARALLSPVE